MMCIIVCQKFSSSQFLQMSCRHCRTIISVVILATDDCHWKSIGSIHNFCTQNLNVAIPLVQAVMAATSCCIFQECTLNLCYLSLRCGWRLLQIAVTRHLHCDSINIRILALYQHGDSGTCWGYTGKTVCERRMRVYSNVRHDISLKTIFV